jgi:hypothetical protein
MVDVSEIKVEYDNPGNPYVEVRCNAKGDMIRVTLCGHAYGAESLPPGIRVQIRPAQGGAPWPGPEFVSDYLPDVIQALARIGVELRELLQGERSGGRGMSEAPTTNSASVDVTASNRRGV